MASSPSRRTFLRSSILFAGTAPSLLYARSRPDEPVAYQNFPAQDPARVREMVGVSHGNVARVKALLAESPALAKATYDWGFGDWETAIGAASHVGNREIAQLLMDSGARPDIFTFAMLGHLDVVKAYIAAQPGIQRVHGPHGLTLLHHARQGKETSAPVVEFLERLGDADLAQTSAPLTGELQQKYVGDYFYGKGETEGLRVAEDRNDKLVIRRLPEGANRPLYHLGDHEFHPAGAKAVRVRFTMENGTARALDVIDGPYVTQAQRRI